MMGLELNLIHQHSRVSLLHRTLWKAFHFCFDLEDTWDIRYLLLYKRTGSLRVSSSPTVQRCLLLCQQWGVTWLVQELLDLCWCRVDIRSSNLLVFCCVYGKLIGVRTFRLLFEELANSSFEHRNHVCRLFQCKWPLAFWILRATDWCWWMFHSSRRSEKFTYRTPLSFQTSSDTSA